MIDWYAYTLTIPQRDMNRPILYWLDDCRDTLPEYLHGAVWGSAKRAGWTVGANIGNHTFIWLRRDGLALIEHTGKGCEYLRKEKMLYDLLRDTCETCTRIDLAHDLHNPDMRVKPEGFAKARGLKRASASGLQESATGQTVYIGSRKSNRYCRVYQYTAPHPRSDFMRIEYVYKKEYAKTVALSLLENSVNDLLLGAASFYEWQHELFDWGLADSAIAVSVPSPHVDRDKEKTLRWLHGPVATSIASMTVSGNLDLEKYFELIRWSVTFLKDGSIDV